MSKELQEISEAEFEAMKGTESLLLIDFFATWCGPCRALAPKLSEVAAGNDKVKVVKVDVDKCPELAKRFGIRGIPALVLLKSGAETDRRAGNVSVDVINDMIKDAEKADEF